MGVLRDTMILVGIISLGANGLILILVAIANPRIDDGSDSPSNERVPLRVITRRDGVMPARRYARPAMELRLVVTREPTRRSAMRTWWKQMRDASDPRTWRRGILASIDGTLVAGSLACSAALGLLIAHLVV